MEIFITSRNVDMNEFLKKHINRKLGKLRNIYKRIYKCEIILDAEKERKNVEVILSLKRNKLVAKDSSVDVLTAVDSVSDKIKGQLRKMNGKISSKRRRKIMKRIVSPISNLSWFDNRGMEE